MKKLLLPLFAVLVFPFALSAQTLEEEHAALQPETQAPAPLDPKSAQTISRQQAERQILPPPALAQLLDSHITQEQGQTIADTPASAAQEEPAAAPKSAPDVSAGELYNRGDYLGAAQAYEKELLANTLPSAYIYYNLANSYFKSGDPDKAIVNYYRAFRLLPRDKDIKRNLAFALNSTGQKLLPEGMPQAAFDAFYLLSARELRGTMWFLGWIFALGFAGVMFGFKKDFCKKAVAASGILLALCSIWYAARLQGDSSPLAVVVVSRAEVRSGPGENFPVSLSVPRAHLVTLSDSKGVWAEIEIPSEQAKGWVLKKSIEEI